MSASLHPPLCFTPSAIPLRPSHSPPPSPAINMYNFMESYTEPFETPESPYPLRYPSPPASDECQRDGPSSTSEPITSRSGMLAVHAYSPTAAHPGETLSAQVDFHNPSSARVRLRIVFGEHTLPTSVNPTVPPLDQNATYRGSKGAWKVSAVVPQIDESSTRATELGPDGRPQWPLNLEALDGSGQILDSIAFGWFVYESPLLSSSRPASDGPRPSTKRPREDTEDHTLPTPSKRPFADLGATSFHRLPFAPSSSSFMDSHQNATVHSPFNEHGPCIGSTGALPPSISFPVQAFHHPPRVSPPQFDISPDAFNIPPPRDDDQAEGTPALVRTTQLFNGVEHKQNTHVAQANIIIEGNLESMKHGWSASERQGKRRLVQFWKRQVGTAFRVSFGELPQHQWEEGMVVISCIYRENVAEFFVTSVDVILLLEGLAGTRFEVEEKNRIRRNLEGFKPMTVSKSKTGTEEFFRILMEFPEPRPRNIEKDVKVFEWGKLRMMIEKVFSKYSTIPHLQSGPLPHSERRLSGSSRMQHNFASNTQGASSEGVSSLPTTPLDPPNLQKQRPLTTAAHLHDAPALAAYLVPSQDMHHDPNSFQPVKFEEYEGPEKYVYGIDTPSQVDPTLLKVNMGLQNMSSGDSTVIPTTPLSCDDSPMSLSLSLSSGSGSDGGSKKTEAMPGLPGMSFSN